MRSDTASALGTALFPALSGFQRIGGQPLRAVWQAEADGCLNRIVFDFDSLSLTVSAVSDDDSVEFEVIDAAGADRTGGADASHLKHWRDLIGAPFGWGWVTVNQQGYCDGLLLSFDGIVPRVVLNVVASSIKIGRVDSMSK
jgi:hypothetical protein